MYQLSNSFHLADLKMSIGAALNSRTPDENRYRRNTCRLSSFAARPCNSFHSQPAWKFRDSDDVLKILPFVVRHAQRRAHSKSAAGSRIPERERGSERNVKSESNYAESLADQPSSRISYTGCRVGKQLFYEKYWDRCTWIFLYFFFSFD